MSNYVVDTTHKGKPATTREHGWMDHTSIQEDLYPEVVVADISAH